MEAQQHVEEPVPAGPTAEPVLRCPKCGATQVHADRRGWGLMTGFIGSGKIYITCLLCAHRFRPGQGGSENAPQAYQPPPPKTELEDATFGTLVLFALVIFLVFMVVIAATAP